MLTAFMRHPCLKYLVNLAARMRHRSTEGGELVKWVLQAADPGPGLAAGAIRSRIG